MQAVAKLFANGQIIALIYIFKSIISMKKAAIVVFAALLSFGQMSYANVSTVTPISTFETCPPGGTIIVIQSKMVVNLNQSKGSIFIQIKNREGVVFEVQRSGGAVQYQFDIASLEKGTYTATVTDERNQVLAAVKFER